jgi:polyphosphate kinase
MWQDNRQAWDLLPDGSYDQRRPLAGEPERSAQKILMELARSSTPQ